MDMKGFVNTSLNGKNKNRNRALIGGVLVLFLVLMLGSGLALQLTGVYSLFHTPGERDVTVYATIQKDGTDVINSVQGKMVYFDVNADETTINFMTDYQLSGAVEGYCTPQSDYSYITGYGYDGPYGTAGYTLSKVGYGEGEYPSEWYSYGTTGYGGYQGYGYGLNDSGDLNCAFTFTDLNEGMYFGIQPILNDIIVSDENQTPFTSFDSVFVILDVSGSGVKTAKFIVPDADMVGGTVVTRVDINGTIGTDYNISGSDQYITLDIDTSFEDGDSIDAGTVEQTGPAFAFGPNDSNFATGVATVIFDYGYAGVTDDQVSNAKILHYSNGSWVRLTTTADTTADTLTADITSFSTYTSGLVDSSSSDDGAGQNYGGGIVTPGTEVISTTTESLSYTPAELEVVLEGMKDDEGNQLFSAEEIADMVDNSTNFEFERTVTVEKITSERGRISYKVTITTTVKNKTTNNLKDVKVVVEVPKVVTSSASDVTSLIPFTVLVNDPVLLFNVATLGAGQEASIVYTVTSGSRPSITGVEFAEPAILESTIVTATPGTDTPGTDTPTTPGTDTPTTPGATPSAPMDFTLIIVVLVVLVVAGAAYFLVIKKK